MANLRALVSMPFLSGKPEDVSVNVLHFAAQTAGEGAADVIRDHVIQLYNVAPPAGPSGNALGTIAGLLSNALSRTTNACTVKVYDLASAEPRIPIVRNWTLGASTNASGNELPAEVALAVSIYAGISRPRTRGRIYFGPFHIAATEDDPTNQRARPGVIVRETLGGAVKRLIGLPGNTHNLGVYSRGIYTVGGVVQPPVAGSMAIATNGWVDDAWDTQRRRGQKATLRYAF